MIAIDWSGITGFIVALGGFVTLLIPAVLSVATFIRTGNLSRQQERLTEHQDALATNVQKIETATNSMKDALVKATRDKSLLEGAATERDAQAARTALKAEGAAEAASIASIASAGSAEPIVVKGSPINVSSEDTG
jgi:hypothetical protein